MLLQLVAGEERRQLGGQVLAGVQLRLPEGGGQVPDHEAPHHLQGLSSGCVTLCTLPYLALPCHMAPESAYGFAFDTLDYLTTK